MMFSKKQISTDFVELSIGKVYLYVLTNGIRNKVYKRTVMSESMVNKSKFFNMFESELLPLNKKQFNNLSIKDGNKIRDRIIALLRENQIVFDAPKEETKKNDKADIFSKQEVEWFDKIKAKQFNTMRRK